MWIQVENESTHSAGLEHDFHIPLNHRPIREADDGSIVTHIRKHLQRASETC